MSKHLREEERSRGYDQAAWAIRDHGDRAEAVIRAKLDRQGISDSDRRRYRHSLRQLRVLRAAQAAGTPVGRRRPSLLRRLLRWLGAGSGATAR